jgi:hypothetical protein
MKGLCNIKDVMLHKKPYERDETVSPNEYVVGLDLTVKNCCPRELRLSRWKGLPRRSGPRIVIVRGRRKSVGPANSRPFSGRHLSRCCRTRPGRLRRSKSHSSESVGLHRARLDYTRRSRTQGLGSSSTPAGSTETGCLHTTYYSLLPG